MTAPDFPAILAEHERAIEADCVPLPSVGAPPFRPGDRVVERGRPDSGLLTVATCDWAHGHWRVEARDGIGRTCSFADLFALAPPGWAEPPQMPSSAVAALECSTDGAIAPAEYAEARRADAAREAEWAEWAGKMQHWWASVGALVNPEIAERQAAGLRKMAANPDTAEPRGAALLRGLVAWALLLPLTALAAALFATGGVAALLDEPLLLRIGITP